MKELNKLFSDNEFQYQDESNKHKKLEICKYSFEISKVVILSLSMDWLLFLYLQFKE